jgi:polyisoprenoid-binding protein YceI
MSRTLSAAAFAILLTIPAVAQEIWQLDPPHASAQFAVRHLGISTVRGSFTKVSGTVQYDPTHLEKTSIQVSIAASSVDTRFEMRDRELRSSDFLDVETYPSITFVSKKVEAAGAGKIKITGDLTIHGITKEVVLDAEGPSTVLIDPSGRKRMGASATAKVNRNDFGVSGLPDAFGDEISITLDVEMIKESPRPKIGELSHPGTHDSGIGQHFRLPDWVLTDIPFIALILCGWPTTENVHHEGAIKSTPQLDGTRGPCFDYRTNGYCALFVRLFAAGIPVASRPVSDPCCSSGPRETVVRLLS